MSTFQCKYHLVRSALELYLLKATYLVKISVSVCHCV
uniref:Uncharacterized protein n=1 Tax=Anguilla anguilla TaxID=7936 RepID=A0A0E9SV27_ANGAN